MSRWFALCLAVYVPHVLEEALTGMCDDPIIAAAYRPLAQLSPRHASYLVFQVMLLLLLVALLIVSLGERGQRVVLGALAVALLCESHHLLRAALSLRYNPGLFTALPMPAVGAVALRKALT